MQALYFGTRDRRLFGVVHAFEGRDRPTPVVICNPIFDEFPASHRAIRGLAQRLAREVGPVLRFDYYGTGDSGGHGEDCDVGGWLHDVGTAIEELKALVGHPSVSLVGIRFGARLALEAMSARRDVHQVVLWDPVVDGSTYVSGLFERHAEALGEDAPRTSSGLEILGYPAPTHLVDEIASTDLTSLASSSDPRVSLVTTVGADADAGVLEPPAQGKAQHCLISGGQPWRLSTEGHQLVPTRAIEAVSDLLGRA